MTETRGGPRPAVKVRLPSVRRNVIVFVAMTAIVVLGTTGLLILLDPRTQAFWIDRWEELKAVLDATFGPLFRR